MKKLDLDELKKSILEKHTAGYHLEGMKVVPN
jgi:hypothetical protein